MHDLHRMNVLKADLLKLQINGM
jgi:hypothetical protein